MALPFLLPTSDVADGALKRISPCHVRLSCCGGSSPDYTYSTRSFAAVSVFSFDSPFVGIDRG